jgi:hypothetical protein
MGNIAPSVELAICAGWNALPVAAISTGRGFNRAGLAANKA